MNVLDLFSGIGGISLGLHRAGMRTVAFCEIDPFCRAVLAKNFPGVPIFDDIKHLRFDSAAKVLYDDRHGPKTQEPCGGAGTLRIGPVASGGRGELRDFQAGHVAMVEGSRCGNEATTEDWVCKPLPPRGVKSERQIAEHAGEGDQEGFGDSQDALRGVRVHRDVQGWSVGDPSAPLRLQQAAGGDVALPEVPPRMAQAQQANRKEVLNGEAVVHGTIDVVVGGFP